MVGLRHQASRGMALQQHSDPLPLYLSKMHRFEYRDSGPDPSELRGARSSRHRGRTWRPFCRFESGAPTGAALVVTVARQSKHDGATIGLKRPEYIAKRISRTQAAVGDPCAERLSIEAAGPKAQGQLAGGVDFGCSG